MVARDQFGSLDGANMTCGIGQRIATDETLEQMLVRMDQRDLVLIETIAKLQNQLSSMTEEVG